MYLKSEKTERGFQYYKFIDRYGCECSLQESSSVHPSIWIGMETDHDGNRAGMINSDKTAYLVDGLILGSRMHLDQEQVKQLLPLLQFFAEHGELPDESEAE